jgi:hypothetical protein
MSTTVERTHEHEADILAAVLAAAPDRAAGDLKARLAVAEAHLTHMEGVPPRQHPGSIPGWVAECRATAERAARLARQVAHAEARGAGEPTPPPEEDPSRSIAAAVLVAAVRASGPAGVPFLIAAAEGLLNGRDAAALAKIDRELSAAADAYRTGQHGVSNERFEALASESIRARKAHQAALTARQEALAVFASTLPIHVGKAVAASGGASALAAGLAEAQVLAGASADRDEEGPRLAAELADVDRQLGRLDGIVAKANPPGLMQAGLQARRKELAELLKRHQDGRRKGVLDGCRAIVAAAAGGDVKAWRSLAEEADRTPAAFAEGTYHRLIDAAASALVDGGAEAFVRTLESI